MTPAGKGSVEEGIEGSRDRGRNRGAGEGVGHWGCGGDSGSEVGGEEGFSEAGVADEEGESAERDAALPEPVDRSGPDVVGEAAGGEVGWCAGHGISGVSRYYSIETRSVKDFRI